MTTDARQILVWPDGTWMNQDEHEDAIDAWRGDDHLPLAVPHRMTDEEIDEAALRAALGGIARRQGDRNEG